MNTTNGKKRMDLANMHPTAMQQPNVQPPAVPLPAIMLAQLAPIVGPMNETEIIEQLAKINPAGFAGEFVIETEITYYEED